MNPEREALHQLKSSHQLALETNKLRANRSHPVSAHYPSFPAWELRKARLLLTNRQLVIKTLFPLSKARNQLILVHNYHPPQIQYRD
jgi:hypothetical protein